MCEWVWRRQELRRLEEVTEPALERRTAHRKLGVHPSPGLAVDLLAALLQRVAALGRGGGVAVPVHPTGHVVVLIVIVIVRLQWRQILCF